MACAGKSGCQKMKLFFFTTKKTSLKKFIKLLYYVYNIKEKQGDGISLPTSLHTCSEVICSEVLKYLETVP